MFRFIFKDIGKKREKEIRGELLRNYIYDCNNFFLFQVDQEMKKTMQGEE